MTPQNNIVSLRIDITLDAFFRLRDKGRLQPGANLDHWITDLVVDELRPILLKYVESNVHLAMKGEEWVQHISAELVIPGELSIEAVTDDLHRKIAVVLDSKGFCENEDYVIQFAQPEY